MSRDVEGEQATMDQKMNELVQQSRVLEAYMNDIVAREATITRLIQELALLLVLFIACSTKPTLSH